MEKAQDSDTYSKKMCDKFKIKDLYDREYLIKNLDGFLEHINKYHANGDSIHEENGFFFKVDDNFRSKIKKYKRK